MKLYYSPGVCSLAPHIALEECALPHELVRVDLATHLTADGTDYYGVSSRGQVPLLELPDGQRLVEGPVIVQYVADVAGNRELMPVAGSRERYRVMSWQGFVATELHKSFAPLFNPALDDRAKATLRDVLQKKYAWLETQLGEAFLTGDAFTGADAYLFAVSRWLPGVGLEASQWPRLERLMRRIASRPAVRAAMRAEDLSEE